MKNVGHISWIIILLGLFSQSVLAQLPEDFSDELVLGDLTQPTGVTFDSRGFGYLWLKAGVVLNFDTLGQLTPSPLIDISDEVGDWGDHGLLGFALDPAFESNGYFYLLYVVDRHHLLHFGSPSYDSETDDYLTATIGRITRFTADLSGQYPSLIPGSRKVLLGHSFEDGFPILMKSHGVGSLAFGLDGSLLASCGEGAHFEGQDFGSNPNTYWEQALTDGLLAPHENIGRFRAQLVDNLCGKIIRLNPETGTGYESNPFYDDSNPQSAASKVWALGFRNPFRFIIQPGTGSHLPEDADPGTLLIGDVGGSQWEELSMASTGGRNFGWPLFEAYNKNWPDFSEPLANQDAPNPLFGEPSCSQEFFLFGDLLKQPTLSGNPGFSNPCNSAIPIPNDIPVFTHTWPLIAWSNKLWNPPARAHIGGFDGGGSPITIEIDAAEASLSGVPFEGFSSIPGCFYTGNIFPEEYHNAFFLVDLSGWVQVLQPDDNDQFTRIEPFLQTAQGPVDLAMNPVDGCLYYPHIYDGQLRKICYGGNPAPIAVMEVDTFYGPSPLTVQFDASESYDPFGLPISYYWDFGDGEDSEAISPSHTFSTTENGPKSYTVTLTVTDSLDVSSEVNKVISLNNTPPTVNITSVIDNDLYTLTGYTWLPLKAQVDDLEHADEELNYSWELFFHHNEHYHAEPADPNRETNVLIEPIGCAQELYWYRIGLTVEDAAGLKGYDEVQIFPDCGDDFFVVDPFTAIATETGIQLDWETFQEDEIVEFQVERTSSFEFQSIGMLSPKGVGSSYSFFDEAPILGPNYYRIKALKSDGRYAYSEPRLVNYPAPTDFRLFPNPTTGAFTIEMQEANSESILLDLFTVGGLPALTLRWEASPGQVFSEMVLTNTLSSGAYYYRVIDGMKVYTGVVTVVGE